MEESSSCLAIRWLWRVSTLTFSASFFVVVAWRFSPFPPQAAKRVMARARTEIRTVVFIGICGLRNIDY